MLLFSQVKKAIVGVVLALLISQQACVSKHAQPISLDESDLSWEKIGLVIKRTPEGEGLKIPGKGVTGGMGRGAAIGAIGGAYGIKGCGDSGCILALPVFMTLGAAGGAVYGGVTSEKASKWDEAEAMFRTHLTELNFDHLLEEWLIAFAQERGCPLQSISGAEMSAGEPIDYVTFSQKSIGLVLELSEITIQLQAKDVNISRLLFTSVRAKVFRTNDGTLLDDRIITDDRGVSRPLDDWMLNNGTMFRDQVSFSAQRMAETIVMVLFVSPSLSPDRSSTPEKNLVTNLMTPNITEYGLKPIYPPLKDFPVQLSSLQPILKWEPYQGDNVTYDLIIWRLTNLSGSVERTEIYSWEGLPEAFHTLETPLQPQEIYEWTVRARYTTSEGHTEITEWAMWSYISDPPHPMYYSFYTK